MDIQDLKFMICPLHLSNRENCENYLCRYYSICPDPAWDEDECKLDYYPEKKLLRIYNKLWRLNNGNQAF